MKEDLKRYFGFDPIVETRTMPCWNLITTTNETKSKLKTKGKSKWIDGDFTGYKFTNVPISTVIERIAYNNYSDAPYIDQTGITGNIDITIDALMTDINDIKKVLQKNGLDWVKGEKEMKVLVIRDAAK